MHTQVDSRFVAGGVRLTLQLEGLALLCLAGVLYARTGASWGMFAALFLVPDLSLLGYLVAPKAGALAYNMLHSEIGPVALGLASVAGVVSATWLPIALIWAAHVGMDRALGFGLKYASAFGDTHLGRVGKSELRSAGTQVA